MNRPVVVLMLALSSACGTGPAPTKVPAGAPSFVVERVRRTDPACSRPVGECAHIDLSWPQFDGTTPLGQALNTWSRRFLAVADPGQDTTPEPDAVAETLITEYLDFKQRFPQSSLPYIVDRSVTLIYANDRIVTLKGLDASYTGGAHGNETVALASFERSSGKQLTVTDLFGIEPSQALLDLVEAAFRQARNVPGDQSLVDAGFAFDNDRFRLPKVVGLGHDGVEFHFNPYEIAPYSMGPTTFVVSYEQLRSHLNHDFLP